MMNEERYKRRCEALTTIIERNAPPVLVFRFCENLMSCIEEKFHKMLWIQIEHHIKIKYWWPIQSKIQSLWYEKIKKDYSWWERKMGIETESIENCFECSISRLEQNDVKCKETGEIVGTFKEVVENNIIAQWCPLKNKDKEDNG